MEDFKKNQERDKDIVFFQIRKGRKTHLLCGCEEKQKRWIIHSPHRKQKSHIGRYGISIHKFEKHKIFLYQEDFEHFMSGLEEAVNFVRAEQPHVEPRQDYHRTNDENETSPNLDFDIDLNIEDIKLAEK